jgi:hypothetical protein
MGNGDVESRPGGPTHLGFGISFGPQHSGEHIRPFAQAKAERIARGGRGLQLGQFPTCGPCALTRRPVCRIFTTAAQRARRAAPRLCRGVPGVVPMWAGPHGDHTGIAPVRRRGPTATAGSPISMLRWASTSEATPAETEMRPGGHRPPLLPGCCRTIRRPGARICESPARWPPPPAQPESSQPRLRPRRRPGRTGARQSRIQTRPAHWRCR